MTAETSEIRDQFPKNQQSNNQEPGLQGLVRLLQASELPIMSTCFAHTSEPNKSGCGHGGKCYCAQKVGTPCERLGSRRNPGIGHAREHCEDTQRKMMAESTHTGLRRLHTELSAFCPRTTNDPLVEHYPGKSQCDQGYQKDNKRDKTAEDARDHLTIIRSGPKRQHGYPI